MAVDGEAVGRAEAPVVYALNKPAGVVSTARDTHGRTTVVELVPSRSRLYPVGRLDVDTTGLILLTNDGELAEPPHAPALRGAAHLPRRSHASRLRRPALRGPARRRGARRRPDRAGGGPPGLVELEITIREGRKRQVRRMCEAVGHR